MNLRFTVRVFEEVCTEYVVEAADSAAARGAALARHRTTPDKEATRVLTAKCVDVEFTEGRGFSG